MEELQVQIGNIQKEIDDFKNKIDIIEGIFGEFSDETDWEEAKNQDKRQPSNEIWKTRKTFLTFTLSQLRDEKNRLRHEKNLLQEKELYLLGARQSEGGRNNNIYLFLFRFI